MVMLFQGHQLYSFYNVKTVLNDWDNKKVPAADTKGYEKLDKVDWIFGL